MKGKDNNGNPSCFIHVSIFNLKCHKNVMQEKVSYATLNPGLHRGFWARVRGRITLHRMNYQPCRLQSKIG